jgi:cytidylate kinase
MTELISKERIGEQPKVAAAVERQMRAWSFAEQMAQRAIRIDGPAERSHKLGRYITLSREEGAGGSEIAELVGQMLDWQVLDANILDRISERYHLPKSMLELVDETRSDWAFDLLGPWIDPHVISHEKYVVHMGRIIVAAARHGNVVLVGRGAQFLLPRDQGLSVRIVAPEKYRVEVLMQRLGVDRARAKHEMHVIDQGRRDFVLRYFRHDVADPHLYDLVLNVADFGPQAAAELIVDAVGKVKVK